MNRRGIRFESSRNPFVTTPKKPQKTAILKNRHHRTRTSDSICFGFSKNILCHPDILQRSLFFNVLYADLHYLLTTSSLFQNKYPGGKSIVADGARKGARLCGNITVTAMRSSFCQKTETFRARVPKTYHSRPRRRTQGKSGTGAVLCPRVRVVWRWYRSCLVRFHWYPPTCSHNARIV